MIKNQLDWLHQFRHCSSLDTLEKVYDNARERLSGKELLAFESAADHRRAEITMKRLYDKIPPSVWTYVKYFRGKPMSEEIKNSFSNIRSLRALAKDVDSAWLEEVRDKLDIVIQEKKDEEELAQLEIREREEKLEKVRSYIAELGLDIAIADSGIQPQAKKSTKRSEIKPKYRFTNEQGETRTWTGRGKTPKFLADKQAQGESLDQYLIEQPE